MTDQSVASALPKGRPSFTFRTDYNSPKIISNSNSKQQKSSSFKFNGNQKTVFMY